MTAVASWDGLALARYRVILEARDSLQLPAYIGSTLRGAFGQVFQRLSCPAPPGAACPVPESCPYHLLFESAPPPNAPALRNLDDIPRPFVFSPPPAAAAEHPAGSEVVFDLSLVGRARGFLPHFVVALRELPGIGRGRRPVTLKRIDAVTPLTGEPSLVYEAQENVVYPTENAVTLHDCAAAACPRESAKMRFVTYTRLKHDGGWSRTPEFHVVFRRLLGRLSSLSLFHCGTPLEADFAGLIEQARAIRLVRDGTQWREWTRFSSRQRRRIPMGGLVGDATYEGELSPFWPFIVFGQWTHVGKGATFGQGRYEIVVANRGEAA